MRIQDPRSHRDFKPATAHLTQAASTVASEGASRVSTAGQDQVDHFRPAMVDGFRAVPSNASARGRASASLKGLRMPSPDQLSAAGHGLRIAAAGRGGRPNTVAAADQALKRAEGKLHRQPGKILAVLGGAVRQAQEAQEISPRQASALLDAGDRLTLLFSGLVKLREPLQGLRLGGFSVCIPVPARPGRRPRRNTDPVAKDSRHNPIAAVPGRRPRVALDPSSSAGNAAGPDSRARSRSRPACRGRRPRRNTDPVAKAPRRNPIAADPRRRPRVALDPSSSAGNAAGADSRARSRSRPVRPGRRPRRNTDPVAKDPRRSPIAADPGQRTRLPPHSSSPPRNPPGSNSAGRAERDGRFNSSARRAGWPRRAVAPGDWSRRVRRRAGPCATGKPGISADPRTLPGSQARASAIDHGVRHGSAAGRRMNGLRICVYLAPFQEGMN